MDSIEKYILHNEESGRRVADGTAEEIAEQIIARKHYYLSGVNKDVVYFASDLKLSTILKIIRKIRSADLYGCTYCPLPFHSPG